MVIVMKISDLSQRIDVRRITLPGDFGFGDPMGVEKSVFKTYASVVEISRKSAVMQDLSVENVHYKLVIRYAHGRMVNKADIVVWNGKRYKAITSSSFKEIDKKKFLETIIVMQDA